MPRVVLASRNAHKIIEMQRILAAADSDIELIGLDELDTPVQDVPETGATFAENALIKAQSVTDQTGMPAISDDSGIAVDALNGMPGVLSARWAGTHGADQANLDLLLAQLRDVPDVRRGGAFVCAIAYTRPGLEPVIAEGVVSGRINREPVGTNGFGYDPIFVPDGYTETTAQLDSAAKDAISHRGAALRELVKLLAFGG